MVTYALAGLIVAYALITSHSIRTFHNHLVEHTDRLNHSIEGLITMSTQDTVNAVVAQLGKAKGEILTQIADLNAQIANAGVAEQVDTSALTAAAQTLDDIVPDAPEVPADTPADVPADEPTF